ncbi:MAG: penicillin acylase family protein [Acidobacteria bacterium]|nr:penicillin acylase family protein [Acidobacteriota bacterium]
MVRCALPFLLCISGFAQTRMIPHVTRSGAGFKTDIILENQTVSTQTYSLTAYAETGASLGTVTGEIKASQVLSMAANDLLPATTSHFTIDNDTVFVSAAYTNAQGPGSPAHVPESGQSATRFRFFSGDWSQIFDGFALVNTGTTASEVWVTQRDGDGNHLQSVQVTGDLTPMAKVLYVVGGPAGSAFTPVSGSYFEVYAQQPLAITLLRGTVPGAAVGLLWANQAHAISQAETKRDGLGVFFIQNGNLYDVFEAMGYNVAQDRLFQADLFRHSARGRLAEWFGQDYLDQDVFSRQTGYTEEELSDAFESLTPDAKTVVQAYVDGLNRQISEVNSTPSLMPAEYVGLELEAVDPWTAEDCLAWVATLQRSFDPSDYAQGQAKNAALFQTLNAAFPATAMGMFEDMRFINDPDAPTMIPGPAQKTTNHRAFQNFQADVPWDLTRWSNRMSQRIEHNRNLLKAINAYTKMGSYAWVLSGDHTVSGNPILYSGPQMGFTVPSICLEGSIRGGGLEISGMSVPGIPGMIVGRTPHHAWSMQVGHAHSADLYIESPDSLGGPHHVETVQVRDGADVQVEVFRSSHGPILDMEPITAWQSAHWGVEFNAMDTYLRLARAQSMEAFGDALVNLGVSQHFCYTDRDGNIAYWMSGHRPVRPEGEFRFPQGLFAPALEYDPTVIEPLPHAANPDQGYFGGWNNKARADIDNSPFSSAFNYGPAHRAQVILDFLASKPKFSFEEVRDLAIDIAATDSFGGGGNPWTFVAEAFQAAVASDSNPTRQAAINLLNAWDGHFIDGGSANWVSGTDRADAWMLQDLWIRKVLQATFVDELGKLDEIVQFQVLLHGLDSASPLPWHYNWFSNGLDATEPQTQNTIILKALDDALNELGMQPWGRDKRDVIDFVHPLLNFSIWKTPFGSRSTYAQVVEMGTNGPVRIQSMFPLGSSGFATLQNGIPVLDEHYLDMTTFFDSFVPRNFPLFD